MTVRARLHHALISLPRELAVAHHADAEPRHRGDVEQRVQPDAEESIVGPLDLHGGTDQFRRERSRDRRGDGCRELTADIGMVR